jgi:hypothetical protein
MDEFEGERFESRDPRDEGRVIEVKELDPSKAGIVYRYVVVANDRNPRTVGRKGHISSTTLIRLYKKVSH